MAVPKKKTSRSRRNMRRSHHGVATPTIVFCECGEPTLPHCVCSSCGTYKGKQVLGESDA